MTARLMIFVMLTLLSLLNKVDAATIYATTCSASDVQLAINSASDGDTVVVPGGTCEWTSQVTMSKAIILIGAGKDVTVIVDKVSDVPALLVDTKEGELTRISGMTWRGDIEKDAFSSIYVSGTSHNFRIDHIKFENVKTRCISIWGYVLGVIDHCDFLISAWPAAIYVDHSHWGGDSYEYGDKSWAEPLYLGTNKALYIEDNVFTLANLAQGRGFALDACGGARLVFRYNTVTNCVISGHGTDTTGRYRSIRSFEIYDNIFTYDNGGQFYNAIQIRGGSGVIYDNTYTGFQYAVNIQTNRTFEYSTKWANCDGTSSYDNNITGVQGSGLVTNSSNGNMTDSSKNWESDIWVGYRLRNLSKTDVSSGIITSNTNNTVTFMSEDGGGKSALYFEAGDQYEIRNTNACIDQPGRGAGLLLSGNPVTNPQWPQQILEPIYGWGNKSTDEGYSKIRAATPDLKENIDFFNGEQKPGYSPYTYPHPLRGEIRGFKGMTISGGISTQ